MIIPHLRSSKKSLLPRHSRANGQALVESILACSVLMLLLLGVQWVWRFAEAGQNNIEAVRFASWERSTGASSGGHDEYALFQTDDEVGASTTKNVYLTATGMLASEENHGGESVKANPSWLTNGAKFFSSPDATPTLDEVINGGSVKVTTSATDLGSVPHGFDPTHDTVTHLALDQNVLNTVTVQVQMGLADMVLNYLNRRLGVVPSANSTLDAKPGLRTAGSLTMISNPWSAPGALATRKIFNELNPLDASNPVGRYMNNGSTFNLAELIGGKAGFAGNYRVDKGGVNPNAAAVLFNGTNTFTFDSNTLTELSSPTNEYKEWFELVAPGKQLEPIYTTMKCKSRVSDEVLRTQYTQDPLCPSGQLRARVISFDNPGYRFH